MSEQATETTVTREGCTTACCLRVYRDILRPVRENADPYRRQPNARVH
jgi:hypothetical protein